MINRIDRRLVVLLVTGALLLATCGLVPSGQTGGQATGAATSSSTSGASQSSQSNQSSPLPAVGTATGTGTITDQASLADALRAKGLTVESGEAVSQPFFDVQGSVLRIEEQDVQVFEFADADAAQAAMATIGPDGTPATTMINWVAPPHFYQAGQLIVLYIGDDAAVTGALTDVMGAQVAGR